MAVADYVLSLCDAVNVNPDMSLGTAKRINVQNSSFEVGASKIIHGLVTFSPAPEGVAVQFLNELEKVRGLAPLVQQVLQPTPKDQWVRAVIKFLTTRFTKRQRVKELKNVTDLASEYLTHLLIARLVRNSGGEKTPQVSVNPSPDRHRALTIRKLLQEVGTKLYRRDGYICPLTGFDFSPDSNVVVNSKAAHIFPFSFHSQHLTLLTIERFTGNQITGNEISDNINNPCNSFNVEGNAHEFYDNLSWGIEAVIQPDNTCSHIYRKIRARNAATITLQDGEEIFFGNGEDGPALDPPKHAFCNLKLAVARVMHASGASEIFDQLYHDEDDEEAVMTMPVYLGGPCVSDEVLFRRIHNELCAV